MSFFRHIACRPFIHAASGLLTGQFKTTAPLPGLAFIRGWLCGGIFQRSGDGRCQIVIFAHHRLAVLGFQYFARIASNGAALLGGRAVIGKALGILSPRDFRGARLAKHGEDQL